MAEQADVVRIMRIDGSLWDVDYGVGSARRVEKRDGDTMRVWEPPSADPAEAQRRMDAYHEAIGAAQRADTLDHAAVCLRPDSIVPCTGDCGAPGDAHRHEDAERRWQGTALVTWCKAAQYIRMLLEESVGQKL